MQKNMVLRVVPPLTLWAINKILVAPPVAKASRRLDRKAMQQKRRLASNLKRASRNASRHPGWLTAGIAAVAFGLSLIAQSARDR